MKFHSKNLQSSFEHAKPILESLNSIEDAISEDIYELESYLKTIHLKESFSFHLQLPDTPAYQEELLVWNHYKQRIVYIKNSYSASCITHDKGYYPLINYNDKENLIEQPLIDAPFALKKLLWETDKLALFLSFLSQKLNQGLGKAASSSII